jgi:hypothetical protein
MRRLRLRKDGVGPLSIGNMIHGVLEVYYARQDRNPAEFDYENPLGELVAARLADPRLPEHLHAAMHEDQELARVMLKGYFEWLQDDGADSNLQILAAEREVEASIGEVNGYLVSLIGKLDVESLLRDCGDRVFVDHKSVQSLGDIPKTGELDEQLRTYGLLQRLVDPENKGGRASGGMWNMLRKVKRTASAKPPFYGRAGVRHNEEVYRNHYRRVWGEVYDLLVVRDQLMAGADHQVVAYPNPTRDCSWDCVFFLVCPRFDDGSDVEAILADAYEEHDPYERYAEVEKQ